MVEEQVIKTIKKYNLINSGDKIVIGVSGGPDSICLLHILNAIKAKLNFEIVVAHINHMIREVADSETEYVKDFCKKIGVLCFIKKVDVISVAKQEKRGTEETGRDIRYDFFNEVALKTDANKIATAHNKNDKVETVIFNILRGSGISGLKGIEAKRDGKYIRPLIEVERDEIEKYCKENKLNPKYDESNFENIYTRNKIRNIVLPYIKEQFNPNFIKAMDRLSEVATEENEYLNNMAKDAFEKLLVDNDGKTFIALDLKKFNNLELVIKRRVILYTINRVLGSVQGIEKINIDDIVKLCRKNIGNKYLIPTKKIKVLVKNNKIYFLLNVGLP